MFRRGRLPAPLRRLAAHMALVMYAVVTLVAPAFVECHETDGRVSLEFGACCCAKDAPRDAEGGGAGPSVACELRCDDCTDVALSERLVGTHAAPRTLPHPADHVALPSLLPVFVALFPPPSRCADAALPRPAAIPPPRAARAFVPRC